jgi:hypothetical protein
LPKLTGQEKYIINSPRGIGNVLWMDFFNIEGQGEGFLPPLKFKSDSGRRRRRIDEEGNKSKKAFPVCPGEAEGPPKRGFVCPRGGLPEMGGRGREGAIIPGWGEQATVSGLLRNSE